MVLANPNPEWKSEAQIVLRRHLDDPRYPKPLTTLELEHQVNKLRCSGDYDMVELADPQEVPSAA